MLVIVPQSQQKMNRMMKCAHHRNGDGNDCQTPGGYAVDGD